MRDNFLYKDGMFIELPASFPKEKFQEFYKQATEFLPRLLSDEYFSDPLKRRQHFDRAWMAVCYRYRACSESNEEFKALLREASDLWREWGDDEEQNYRLERCLYQFFMSGLSVFESMGFCLYFVGVAMRPTEFPHGTEPQKINLKAAAEAFAVAFPQASISHHLSELRKAPEFKKLKAVRHILAHRLTGRRSIRVTDTRKEVWNLPGSDTELIFDEEMTQLHLDAITGLLTALVETSLEFFHNSKPAKAST